MFTVTVIKYPFKFTTFRKVKKQFVESNLDP